MQDEHAGKPGTFYTCPKTGKRLTQKEWDAQQAKNTDKKGK